MLATLSYGLAATIVALAACVAWFESQLESSDRLMLVAAGLVLCLPSLLIGLGQYRLFLRLGITGTSLAVFLAHVLPVMAYVFVMLHGPYRSFDNRWREVSSGLMVSRSRFLFSVKWPMLKANLWAAAAVGFAVAVAQFVPVQLAAAGRHATLATEAVTLTSGGNRALIATYALALTLLPLSGFGLAALMGKSRWKLRDA